MGRYYFIIALILLYNFTFIGNKIYAAEWSPEAKSSFIKKLIEKRSEKQKKRGGSNIGFYVKGKGKSYQEEINKRSFIVYSPPKLPKSGKIPLLIVLHGGFGNSAHIQKYIGLDPLADKYGFVIAYLNGTQVAKSIPEKFRGWNAGGCCGQPERKKINDISHVANVIDYLSNKYGIDSDQVYGTGHSNGAMMSLRIMCEADLYRSAVTVSGTLQLEIKNCPYAHGKKVLNIHGENDSNLPVEGGHTKTGINKSTNYKSQSYSKSLFENSGGEYDLLLLNGADHGPETINEALWKTENISLPQKIVNELGLNYSFN